MERLLIRGGAALRGNVEISGAKNAALPQIAASLLSEEPLTLTNVPDLADIRTMLALMECYGVDITRGAGALTLTAGGASAARE